MRPIYLTLPLGALLACVGAMMFMKSKTMPVAASGGLQPTHPVTDQMRKGVDEKAKKDAPGFELADAKGEKHSLAELGKDKPVFIYFILDGCPCSIEAEPLFNELHKVHGSKVNFVGIISSDQKTAASWVDKFKTPNLVLADPKEVAVSAYEAPSSAYSALVVDGKIEKMWPGYSKSILLDMNHEMAKASSIKEPKFDTQYAPLKDSTGCTFNWVSKTKS